MAQPSNKGGRPLAIVVFDCQAQTSLAVEMTHFAAKKVSSKLLGVLIDEVELLEHAQSRLAREILHSGADRPLEAVKLSRQIRARSKQAQIEFEKTAAMLGLPHEFRSAKGGTLSELAKWADESRARVATLAADLVAKRTAWRSALHDLSSAPIRTLLFAREGWRIGTSVLAVIDDIKAADAMLATAQRLAQGSRSPLFLALSKEATNDTEAAEKLFASAQTNLSTTVRVISPLDDTGPNAIVAAIRQTHARIAVLSWNLAEKSPDLIERLLIGTTAAIALVK